MQNRDLPVDETENPVHRPATGRQQKIPPSLAAPVDSHRRPSAPVPSSAPKSPSGRQYTKEQKRMAEADRKRVLDEDRDYGRDTRAMASLESESESEADRTHFPMPSWTISDDDMEGSVTPQSDTSVVGRRVRNPSEWAPEHDPGGMADDEFASPATATPATPASPLWSNVVNHGDEYNPHSFPHNLAGEITSGSRSPSMDSPDESSEPTAKKRRRDPLRGGAKDIGEETDATNAPYQPTDTDESIRC